MLYFVALRPEPPESDGFRVTVTSERYQPLSPSVPASEHVVTGACVCVPLFTFAYEYVGPPGSPLSVYVYP